MDGEDVLGYLMALAWGGALIYMVVLEVREAGSLWAWISKLWTKPITSLASILMWLGMMGFILYLITAGRVPPYLILAAPLGFGLLFLAKRLKL